MAEGNTYAMRFVGGAEDPECVVAQGPGASTPAAAEFSYLPTGGLDVSPPWVWQNPSFPNLPYSIHKVVALARKEQGRGESEFSGQRKAEYSYDVSVEWDNIPGKPRSFTVRGTATDNSTTYKGTVMHLNGAGALTGDGQGIDEFYGTIVVVPNDRLKKEIGVVLADDKAMPVLAGPCIVLSDVRVVGLTGNEGTVSRRLRAVDEEHLKHLNMWLDECVERQEQ